MAHRAELIAVGTEILLGNVANLDAQMISEGLCALGIDVHFHTVVGDNPARLEECLAAAEKRADIIITTGGLGPTYDDLTKQTVCAHFGRALHLREDAAQALREHFAAQGKVMTDNNLQQAMLPDECTVFDNPVGTAPGCAFCADGVHVLMLPGPPHECRYMFENRAVPYLRALSDDVLVSHNIRIYGKGESEVEAMLRERIETMVNPSVAPYAKTNECLLRVTAKAASEQEGEAMCRGVVEELCALLGDCVYGVDAESLEKVCFDLLRSRGLTMAAAESCTGGLIAQRMTELSGASEVFRGGVVSYTDFVKENALGVSGETLASFGAVSEPTAREMAEGVRRVCGADIGVSVTGIAGPATDERGTPVGTVYVGLAAREGTFVRKLTLGNRGRGRIRGHAANTAFDMIRRLLSGKPLE